MLTQTKLSAHGAEGLLCPENSLRWDAVISLARADFWCFVELMFPVLHPGEPLIFAPYLELIASMLMRVEEGKYRRVLINLPPRHMKSILTSVLYPAWRLGRDPTAKFICISYSDDLAHDLSNSTRKAMRDPLYRAIFPGTRLDKSAVDYIRTPQGGYRYATAVGSTITGFGADEIIIDDPLQPEDATSESAKLRFRSWLASSVLTRFNNPNLGALILVMHRLAPDDPSADMEASADYQIKLPLIAETEEKFSWNGRLMFYREPGDPLNPDRFNLQQIERLRASVPPHVYASLNVQRLRLELPEVLAAIKAANLRERPSLIVIDERGVGLGVYQQLEREGYRHVKGSIKTSDPLEREGQPPTKPSASKVARFGRAALQIGDGRVLVPTHASWLDHFLNEVASFPNIADKDQVDSMTQLVGSLDRAIFLARLFKSRGLQ